MPEPAPERGIGARVTQPPLLSSANFEERLTGNDHTLAFYKGAVQEIAATLVEQFDAGVQADVLVKARAAALDRVLRAAWDAYVGDFGNRAALVPVGGYGRAELHPGSDIDLLLLIPDGVADTSEEMRSRRVVHHPSLGYGPRRWAKRAHGVAVRCRRNR